MNVGKCPNGECRQTLTHIKFETVTVRADLADRYVGVTYLCPHCDTVLGAGIDPVALKTDTINGVVMRLKKGS